MTKFDDNWASVFDTFSVSEEVANKGYCDIEARQFKSLHLEPRLLTKIDHSHRLPSVMKEHGLSILTLSNSTWRVGPFRIFEELPQWSAPNSEVSYLSLPDWLESLTVESITGEGAMLNAADVSGMLEDFFGEPATCTITGRGGSGSFSFGVDNLTGGQSQIHVDKAQIEIDGGFEGKEGLYLIEAKKHLSLDFNVRQLYYPYRTWSSKVTKPVRPVFATLANDVYELTEFRFNDPENLSSIELVSSRRYMLSPGEINPEEIRAIARTAKVSESPFSVEKIPFPQADNFERVIDLLEFVAEGPRTTEDIAAEYEFVPRQSDYYFAALRYLGLGELEIGPEGVRVRKATDLGIKISALSFVQKRLELSKILLKVSSVNQVFSTFLQSGSYMTVDEVEKIVGLEREQEGISGATVRRRAQTVLAWCKWLGSLGKTF